MARARAAISEPVWLLPDEPIPIRLMNTVWADRRGVHDSLCTPGDLKGWLAATGLSAGPMTSDDVSEFRGLRDALRRLAALLTEDTRPAAASPLQDVREAVTAINVAADADPAGPRLTLRDSQLERDDTPATPAAALATVARDAVALLTDDGIERQLCACHAPGCVLYFVKDHPRRGWCSVACGNRARAARYYRRRRGDSAGGDSQGGDNADERHPPSAEAQGAVPD